MAGLCRGVLPLSWVGRGLFEVERPTEDLAKKLLNRPQLTLPESRALSDSLPGRGSGHPPALLTLWMNPALWVGAGEKGKSVPLPAFLLFSPLGSSQPCASKSQKKMPQGSLSLCASGSPHSPGGCRPWDWHQGPGRLSTRATRATGAR